MSTILGVDVGGTFTDFLLWRDGKLSVHKRASTPDAPSRAVPLGLEEADLAPDEVIHREADHRMLGPMRWYAVFMALLAGIMAVSAACWLWGEGWNSNSAARELLESAGLPVGKPEGYSVPLWDRDLLP